MQNKALLDITLSLCMINNFQNERFFAWFTNYVKINFFFAWFTIFKFNFSLHGSQLMFSLHGSKF